jgi:hypothetical protein
VTTYATPRFDGFVGVLTGAIGLSVLVFGYSLLPVSALGGAWIAAVGASLLCAVLVGSTWGRRRLGLVPSSGTSAALGFLLLALLLAVSFVLVNGAAFEGGFVAA